MSLSGGYFHQLFCKNFQTLLKVCGGFLKEVSKMRRPTLVCGCWLLQWTLALCTPHYYKHPRLTDRHPCLFITDCNTVRNFFKEVSKMRHPTLVCGCWLLQWTLALCTPHYYKHPRLTDRHPCLFITDCNTVRNFCYHRISLLKTLSHCFESVLNNSSWLYI